MGSRLNIGSVSKGSLKKPSGRRVFFPLPLSHAVLLSNLEEKCTGLVEVVKELVKAGVHLNHKNKVCANLADRI